MTMRVRAGVLTALSTVACAGALGAVAEARGATLSLVSRPTPFTAGCNGTPQPGVVYRNSEVEPHLAVNPVTPRNLIAAWQQDRWSTGGADGLLSAYSQDGGRTWKRASSPPFARCQGGGPTNGGDYERTTDPWVSFGPTGIAYQIALSGNGVFLGRNAVLASRSLDGGATWGPVKTVLADDGPFLTNDKEAITADPTDPRYVYATWWRYDIRGGGERGPALFARSADRGRTWELAREIYDPAGRGSQTLANQILVEPNGDLVNAFALITTQPTEFRVALIRSKDKGRTWSPPVSVARLASYPVTSDPRDGALVRAGEIVPDFAVDPRRGKRALYAAWQDTRFTFRTQIALSRSKDGGRTWSQPVRVSANPATQAFTPAVEVNRRGEVAVSYYDFTRDSVQSVSLDTDHWVARSRDGGRTFTPRRRLTRRPFDLRTAPNARGFFVGDYQGLAAAGDHFKVLFSRTTGDPGNPTDLFSTTVRGSFPRRRGSAARSDHRPGRSVAAPVGRGPFRRR